MKNTTAYELESLDSESVEQVKGGWHRGWRGGWGHGGGYYGGGPGPGWYAREMYRDAMWAREAAYAQNAMYQRAAWDAYYGGGGGGGGGWGWDGGW